MELGRNMENVEKLIKLSSELLDYSKSMQMATKYKANEFNFGYYTLVLQQARQEVHKLES